MTRDASDPRDVVDDRRDVEPAALPPAPSVEFPDGEFTPEEQAARMPPPRDPRPEPRIAPVPPPPGWKPVTAKDVDDAALLSQEFRLLRGEMRDGFKRVFEVLAAIERHEVQLQHDRRDINDQQRQIHSLGHDIAQLKAQGAETRALVEKLSKNAAKRAAGGKR